MKFGQFMSHYKIKNFIKKFCKNCGLKTSSRPFCVYKELSTVSIGKWNFWSKLLILDDLVASFIKDKMDIDLSVNDIDRTHRIGKPSPRKIRPIIVKFVRYNDRRKVFSNKKKLKNSGISITESSTARRMGELSKARNKYGFKNVWTIDGKENGSNKAKLFYG